MQELNKFSLKINAMPNGLENYMSFNIINKLIFIDSFQFLNSSLDSLFKKTSKNDIKYLSQELYNNVLDLVKQKGFDPNECMSNFEKFTEQLTNKYIFHSS